MYAQFKFVKIDLLFDVEMASENAQLAIIKQLQLKTFFTDEEMFLVKFSGI